MCTSPRPVYYSAVPLIPPPRPTRTSFHSPHSFLPSSIGRVTPPLPTEVPSFLCPPKDDINNLVPFFPFATPLKDVLAPSCTTLIRAPTSHIVHPTESDLPSSTPNFSRPLILSRTCFRLSSKKLIAPRRTTRRRSRINLSNRVISPALSWFPALRQLFSIQRLAQRARRRRFRGYLPFAIGVKPALARASRYFRCFRRSRVIAIVR